VHSTVNVASGQGQPTIPDLADLLENDKPLGRTTVNSWEDTTTDTRRTNRGPTSAPGTPRSPCAVMLRRVYASDVFAWER
jgi:hypothetical protein